MRKRRQSPASLLVGLIGLVGMVVLLVLSDHHPASAAFLQVMAVVWLLGFGLARLVVEVVEDDRACAEDDRLAGPGFDFTRNGR